MHMEAIEQGLYRILLPFETITTTVYAVVTEQGAALIDSGTYSSDVGDYILPALRRAGVADRNVKYLLLSHLHGDHAGGMDALLASFPHARLLAPRGNRWNAPAAVDGQVILGRLQVVHLPGHTANSVGFYDLKTKTLLSADCLQLKGIGKYRNGIGDPRAYRASIEKLQAMDIYRIVAAHEYDPMGSIAQGDEAVKLYLETCLREICF